MAQALANKTIDVAELCSTQPDIAVNGFVVLTDDKQTQPADNIAPLVRDDSSPRWTRLPQEDPQQRLGQDDTASLTQLNKQVAVDQMDIAAVAKAWLQSVGLVK